MDKIKNTTETRAQTIEKLKFYLPKLTDKQLRIVVGFAKGLWKNG